MQMVPPRAGGAIGAGSQHSRRGDDNQDWDQQDYGQDDGWQGSWNEEEQEQAPAPKGMLRPKIPSSSHPLLQATAKAQPKARPSGGPRPPAHPPNLAQGKQEEKEWDEPWDEEEEWWEEEETWEDEGGEWKDWSNKKEMPAPWIKQQSQQEQQNWNQNERKEEKPGKGSKGKGKNREWQNNEGGSKRPWNQQGEDDGQPPNKKGKGKGKEGKGKEGKGNCRSNVREEEPERIGENGSWEEHKDQVGFKLCGEIAVAKRWNYIIRDDSRRSYAGMLANGIPKTQCERFFTEVKEGTEWGIPQAKHGAVPRKTAWMVSGKNGCSCTYRYGGIEVEAQLFPQWMLQLMAVVMPMCGLPNRQDWPDSCNMNLYEDGGQSVGWHADDERLFQGKFMDTKIISVTFGAKRRFEVRPNWPQEDDKRLHRVMLGDGDIMTMEGMFQKHFQHRVPKEGGEHGPRINLTWRFILKHNPRCPAGRIRH